MSVSVWPGPASCSRYPGPGGEGGRALRRGAGRDDPHLQTRVSDVSVTPALELTQPGLSHAGRGLSDPCSRTALSLPRPPIVARRPRRHDGEWMVPVQGGVRRAGPGGTTVMMTPGESECLADAITAAR